MKKILLILFIAVSAIGCKKHKGDSLLDEANATKHKTALIILNDHAKNAQDFKSTFIKSTIVYESGSSNQKVTADIAIEKDKQIFVNIRVLGFTAAKALITPSKVEYYIPFNSEYFEGDFDVLSKYVGTELDYNRLQNLLMGQVLDSKSETNLLATIEDGLHRLAPAEQKDLASNYFFEDKSALLKKEEITQASTNRKVTISYPNYQRIQKYVVPTEINIQAVQEKSINLNLRYDKVTFDDDYQIRYSVPKGYKRIGLK